MKTPGGLSGSDNTSRMNNLVRTQIPSSNEPGEGIDHYKKLFSFSKLRHRNNLSFILAQRKVEFENFRFKHPSMLAVVIESINTKVIDTQRLIGRFFFRFHVSDDINIGEL